MRLIRFKRQEDLDNYLKDSELYYGEILLTENDIERLLAGEVFCLQTGEYEFTLSRFDGMNNESVTEEEYDEHYST